MKQVKQARQATRDVLLSHNWFRTKEIEHDGVVLRLKELTGEQRQEIQDKVDAHREKLGLDKDSPASVPFVQRFLTEWGIRSLIDEDGEFIFTNDEDVEEAYHKFPPVLKGKIFKAADVLNVITGTQEEEVKKKSKDEEKTSSSTTQSLAAS